MKKNSFTFLSTFVLLALALTSCAPDSAFNIDPSTGDDSFCLSSKRGAFTRAGEGSTFAEGTKYQLYAITSADGFTKNYLQAGAASGAVTGTETAGHIGGIAAHTFGGKELDFYAMTDGTDRAITLQVNESTKEPAYTFTYNTADNDYLSTEPTDALWAKKENQTCKNAGVIDLPFKHVMAKLNLFVVKQMDVNSTIYLDEIYIKDYPSGSFNLQTGKFDFGSQTRNKKSIRMWNYTSPSYMQEVTTMMMPVVSGEKSSLLVFPTKESNASTGNDALTIGVKYFKGTNTPDNYMEIPILSTLSADASGTTKEVPFPFESNREYDLIITLTGSSLVVSIVPRAYDWIESEDIKTDTQVSASVTIGGITWMDRNLGATSGDPTAGDQAWEDSRGYYYQFGRNIPYYIKPKEDTSASPSVWYAPSAGSTHIDAARPFPFIPGKMDQAPVSVWPTNSIATDPIDIADKNPVSFFNFYSSNGITDWAVNTSGFTWPTPEKQPCPKGWRLPTSDEFKLIIPATDAAGNITFSGISGNTYLTGVDNDPEVNSHSDYVGVKSEAGILQKGVTHSIYALKRKGKGNAYYLRWHIERSGTGTVDSEAGGTNDGSKYRNVLVISRYPATAESNLTQENVATAAKWDYPIEQIKLPISGYIHTVNSPALIYSGTEAVYWTSTINDSYSYTVRMKFSGSGGNEYISMYPNEVRKNGCLIRCVRDTNAN